MKQVKNNWVWMNILCISWNITNYAINNYLTYKGKMLRNQKPFRPNRNKWHHGWVHSLFHADNVLQCISINGKKYFLFFCGFLFLWCWTKCQELIYAICLKIPETTQKALFNTTYFFSLKITDFSSFCINWASIVSL